MANFRSVVAYTYVISCKDGVLRPWRATDIEFDRDPTGRTGATLSHPDVARVTSVNETSNVASADLMRGRCVRLP